MGNLRLAKNKQRMMALNLLVQQVLGKIVNPRKVKDFLSSFGTMIKGINSSSYVNSMSLFFRVVHE